MCVNSRFRCDTNNVSIYLPPTQGLAGRVKPALPILERRKKMKTDKYWDEQVYDKDLIYIIVAILCKISYYNLYDIEDWDNLY